MTFNNFYSIENLELTYTLCNKTLADLLRKSQVINPIDKFVETLLDAVEKTYLGKHEGVFLHFGNQKRFLKFLEEIMDGTGKVDTEQADNIFMALATHMEEKHMEENGQDIMEIILKLTSANLSDAQKTAKRFLEYSANAQRAKEDAKNHRHPNTQVRDFEIVNEIFKNNDIHYRFIS